MIDGASRARLRRRVALKMIRVSPNISPLGSSAVFSTEVLRVPIHGLGLIGSRQMDVIDQVPELRLGGSRAQPAERARPARDDAKGRRQRSFCGRRRSRFGPGDIDLDVDDRPGRHFVGVRCAFGDRDDIAGFVDIDHVATPLGELPSTMVMIEVRPTCWCGAIDSPAIRN